MQQQCSHDVRFPVAGSVVTALAAQIAALPAQTLTELAAAMAAIDAPVAEQFADALLDAVYDATVVEFRPPFFVEPAAAHLHRSALDDDIDDDAGYEYALASAQ